MPPQLIPTSLSLEHYRLLFSDMRTITRFIINTVIVTVATMVLAGFVTLTAGYSFTLKFPGYKVAFWIVLLAAVVPGSALIIPRYLALRAVRLSTGLIAAVLPLTLWPWGILLARALMSQLTPAYIEEARMAGAGEWYILASIVTPMSTTVVALVIISQGLGILGDYLWQSIVLQFPSQQTMLVGLMTLLFDPAQRGLPMNLGLQMAIGTVLFVPLLIVFLIGHRWFLGDGKGLQL